MPTERLDTLLSLILAAAIVVSMQVMSVALIAAAIAIPPIVARLLTDSFSRVMTLSVVGAACGLMGMYLSYLVDVSSGANVVLVATAFVLAMAYSAVRNRLASVRGTLAVREQTVLE